MKHIAQLQVEFLKEAYFADAYNTFETWLTGQTFFHPDTHNRVQYRSLPKHTQQFIKMKWDKIQAQKLLQNIMETSGRSR